MASQPPIQYNQIPPSLPTNATTGLSRPPLLQPPAINGIGQPQTSSGFPQPSPSNYPPLNNPASLQWARPQVPGQGTNSNQVSQAYPSLPGQQPFNPAVYGQNSPRPLPPGLNSGRQPGPPTSSSLSGNLNLVSINRITEFAI